MRYVSTRGQVKPVLFSEALEQSLAPDGGLYFPQQFPRLDMNDFSSADSLAEIAYKVLAPWLAEDPLFVQLNLICKSAFDFPAPLEFLEEDIALLELFHGPTAAFKDFGARFLSECVSRLPNLKSRTVLVATSGDTGGAVAAAFYGKPEIQVVILFPKGRVSIRQEKQLTNWGKNVKAFSVRGSFDDCQSVVKAAFADKELQQNNPLLSANSINIGRILPQSVYYAASSLSYFRKRGVAPGIIVPSGNLGNAVAAVWAKKMGFPIREIFLATNANRPVPDYFNTGIWKPHPTIATLANAMDVGNPSNIERMIRIYPQLIDLKRDLHALSVTDLEISQTILDGLKRWNQVFCPHTATAVFAHQRIVEGNQESNQKSDWIIVATAHPAKFDTVVEPLIGKSIEVPAPLEKIISQPSQVVEMSPSLDELKQHLLTLK